MYTCPYCKIRVGGASEKCPLCQSRLFGDGEEPHFPTVENLKIRSFLYRLQMFIVLCAVIVGLGLDFLFHLEIPAFPGLHWSLILAMWLLVSEFLIVRKFRPGTGSARKVTLMAWVILGMLLITAHFFNFMWLAWDWILPIALGGMMLADFVLMILDRQGNAMAYLLSGLISGVIPCILRFFMDDRMPILWTICAIIAVILLVGAAVFKGRAVAGELRKSFNV